MISAKDATQKDLGDNLPYPFNDTGEHKKQKHTLSKLGITLFTQNVIRHCSKNIWMFTIVSAKEGIMKGRTQSQGLEGLLCEWQCYNVEVEELIYLLIRRFSEISCCNIMAQHLHGYHKLAY